MNENKFTLGSCDFEGKKYEFRYDNGVYTIVELKDEDNIFEKFKSKDKDASYLEWNKMKRPEKTKA